MHLWPVCSAFHDSDIEGDTSPQGDAVANQYLHLPYPVVTNADVAGEQNFYKSDRWNGEVMWLYASLTLENINHVLFNGDQTFR